MSVSVDPFVIPIPQKWADDPELAPTIQYIWRYLYDLRERTGGGDDAIAALEDSALYDVGIKGAEIAEIQKQIEELKIQHDILVGIIYGLQDALSKQIASVEVQDNSLQVLTEIGELRKRLDEIEVGGIAENSVTLAEITELRKRIEAIENGYDP